jgi:hypothetical protein
MFPADRPIVGNDMKMFDAFEKQAGLKLEAVKTGVQVVVVDRFEVYFYRERSNAIRRSFRFSTEVSDLLQKI